MDTVQKTHKKFYDINAQKWSDTKTNSFWHEKPFREFIKYLQPDDTVIDIGCGYGIHVPLFLGIGRHLKYEGMDISESMLELAKLRYPQLIFQLGDITDKNTLPNKKYDAFWASAVLMHVPEQDWPKMLENIEGIIKKGGYGYFTLTKLRPNPSSDTDQRHFSLLDSDALKRLLEPRGWKVIEQSVGALKSSISGIDWDWYIVKLP